MFAFNNYLFKIRSERIFLILIYLRLYRVVWRLYKMEKFKAVGDPSVRENESHFTYITVHGHHLTLWLSGSVYNAWELSTFKARLGWAIKPISSVHQGKWSYCRVPYTYYYTRLRITRRKPRTQSDEDVWRDGVEMVN